MGKASRIKQRRRVSPIRQTIVVDTCEIGQLDGMFTARVAQRGPSRPVCLALPAEAAASLVDRLRVMCFDAEETYWDVIRFVMHGITPGDADTATAAMRAFLLKQNWLSVVAQAPVEPDETFLVSHVGHVGLVIAPPFVDQRSLLIFDPMQLRRLGPALQSAVAGAHAAAQPLVTPAMVAAVVEFLKTEPWDRAWLPEPTFEQARAEMQKRYGAFLAREPYIRPAEHNLPDKTH